LENFEAPESENIEERIDNELPPQEGEVNIPTIDIETLKEMLGEVSRTPEVEKEVETEGEKKEFEEVDFSILGEALYSIYTQGLRWATYIVLSRIIPGYEDEVLRSVSLPKSAQKQLVKAFNRFLQKKFADWSIQLSEEGLVLSLMLLYSITYIGQAVMLAYQLKRMQFLQMQAQMQTQTQEQEKPTPKRSSRRRSSKSRSRSRRSRRTTEDIVTDETITDA
jgi:hypothetical protein